jgi:mono/diheme cytochrome c family protein
MMKTINRTGILIVVFIFTSYLAMSQDFPEWTAPDEASTVENPNKPTKESLENGMAFFNLQCKACHGSKCLGDGLIKSANLTTENFLAQSDGAIFWKIKQGRTQMPSFKALPENQLWDVINYVRSLSVSNENLVKKNAIIKLFFNENADTREISAKVFEIAEDNKQVPCSSAKVNFGVRRYFGILPIANETSHYTNENGEVDIQFTENIIGNENGELTIIASIEGLEYNPAEISEVIAWGSVNPNNYWSERRALWKNNEYVPLWLLISFITGALAIWGVIAYVGMLVYKIKKIGDKTV